MNTRSLAALPDALDRVPGPVLTWYSAAGERVELSGRTLARWVAKTAHLLADLDAEPGEHLLVDLGPAWRAPAFWLAAWRLGLTVATSGAAGPVDLAAVRDAPHTGTVTGCPADRLVVVPEAVLAVRAEHVPVAATDYAATVNAYPDVAPPAAAEPEPALRTGTTTVAAAALLGSGEPPARRWFGPSDGPDVIVSTWATGGSVVWHAGLDPAEAARLREAEHAV